MRLRRNLLLLPVACLVIAALAAQSPSDPDWQTAAGGKMAFEVASVKPAKLGKPETFILPTFWLGLDEAKPPGGRFRGSFPLVNYISFAWKLQPFQMEPGRAQLPKWANDLYLIDAKADGNPTKDQMRLMMQSLLADRFKLRVHFETKEVPVLALTLAEPGKLGANLHPHSEGPPCPDSFEMPKPLTLPPLPKPGDVFPAQCGTHAQVWGTSDSTRLGSRNTTMGLLAQDIYDYGSLLGELDKPVVDQTGLQGRFDFMLELPAGMISFGPKPPSPDDAPKGTAFLDAVRKQMGLKLERSRGEARTLLVDHVERPSEN